MDWLGEAIDYLLSLLVAIAVGLWDFFAGTVADWWGLFMELSAFLWNGSLRQVDAFICWLVTVVGHPIFDFIEATTLGVVGGCVADGVLLWNGAVTAWNGSGLSQGTRIIGTFVDVPALLQAWGIVVCAWAFVWVARLVLKAIPGIW